MSKFEELFDFDIKPELPYGEMVELRKGYRQVESELDLDNIYFVYNTEFPRAMHQVCTTDYSGNKILGRYYFWATKFARKDEHVIYGIEDCDEIPKYRKEARVPFMFKLAIPDEWLADIDCCYARYTENRYYFPFFTYPCSECTDNVEDYLKKGHTLIKTGKQYDEWDEYQISDTKEKVVCREFRTLYNEVKKQYYLVEPIPFCKVENYFVSPLLFRKDVPKDQIKEHMQEIWDSVFDKKIFLKTMKEQLQKSFTRHFLEAEIQDTKELKPITLMSPSKDIHDERFEKESTREISDYAILTGGLGLVNMNMVYKSFSKMENFIEGRGIPECSYLKDWVFLEANWDLETARKLGYTGTINIARDGICKNADFSFLGLRLGFNFNSKKIFSKVEGNIGWLREEAPQTVLSDGYQELFEKAYQKGLLEKTDDYFTNPKTKEKQRAYHAFGIKAIRVIPSFYETKSFYNHLSNGNVYRPDYKEPIWVRVEPIECLIDGNYAEFRKILIAGLPIKIASNDLIKVQKELKNNGIIYSIPRIENLHEIIVYVNNVFAKEISRVSELKPYLQVHPDEADTLYGICKDFFPEDERPYTLKLSLYKKTTKDYLDEKRR